MILNKDKVKQLVGVWCHLDNQFGFLDELIRKSTDKGLIRLLNRELKNTDTMRTNIMGIWNFTDYDRFVEFVVEGYYNWNSKLNRWVDKR